MPNEQEDVKFLKYKTKILAVNTGDQPDRLTHDIIVPEFRGYRTGERIPAGTLLSAIVEKEFNSAPPAVTVTIRIVGNGTTSPIAGSHTVSYGGDFTINSATPAGGWKLGSVVVDGSTVTLPNTISNITTSKTVTVTFVEEASYTVTPQAGSNGSISPNYPSSFSEGMSVNLQFTATPASGYEVDKWQLNGSDVQTGGTSYTLVISSINADQTVKVLFKELPVTPQYTISGEAGANGTISPSGVAQTHDEHTASTAQLFTATPAAGYVVDRWLRNGTAISGETGTTYTLPAIADMTENVVIKVEFKEVVADTYTVTVTDNTPSSLVNPGTISPAAGSHTVNVGTDTTVTVTPNTGFRIKTFTVDGVDQTSPYTITGAAKDQTVAVVVEFEPVPAGNIYGHAYTQADGRTWREPTAEYIVLGTPDADTAASMAQITAGTYNWTSKPQAKSIETFVIAKSVGRVTSIKDALDSECLGDTMAEKTVTIDGVDYWVYYNTSTVGAGNASYVIKGA